MKPRYRIIDARKTRAATLYPEAVARRPFEIHSQVAPGGKFLAIPGASYETKEKAIEAAAKMP